ncbi:peptide chain release factor N(5)-glutamine methyltransferase [bacterium]|nr:peptide chain release factor N(5)-glutamine methyltransferase [bacterium]NBX97607.1 peptide chain release factor N(5)-glutamine methyltransferase [bacterium]NDC94562.1 peptide chain release factor N(5)-glutamine methyltransferase [bacterium]NDD84143.1 peptide chain release factor N(5)-glutamine methyltransferase [bacterium]NDG29970.1 peptide chain release factor N(5)-glutamine methyltransferase [bacterium]
MTINKHLLDAAKQLKTPTPRLDAEVLLCFVLGKDKAWLRAHDDAALTDEQIKKYLKFVTRRALGEPLAYIVGSKEFYGRDFVVNKHVLVPRPESESFIELLKELKNNTTIHGFLHSVIDIGTGSGCLAITTKLEFPDTFVTATDISSAALKVAIANALHYETPVVFKKQSLLTGDKQGYDVILANLPYVPEAMQNPSIMREPAKALFSGADGLDQYHKLFKQLSDKHIRFVLTESLLLQHEAIILLAKAASYELIKTDGLVQAFRKTPYRY